MGPFRATHDFPRQQLLLHSYFSAHRRGGSICNSEHHKDFRAERIAVTVTILLTVRGSMLASQGGAVIL